MSAHTPGPWFVDPNNRYAVLRQFTFPRIVNEVVAKANRAWMTPDEREANARLIAAAPELLAACKSFVEYEKAMDSGDHVGGMLAYSQFSREARQAIAKATVEAP